MDWIRQANSLLWMGTFWINDHPNARSDFMRCRPTGNLRSARLLKKWTDFEKRSRLDQLCNPIGVERLEPRTLLNCDPGDMMPGPDNDPVRMAEHLSVMKLVPCEAVTHEAVMSGEWDNPATWDHGVPGSNANVLVPMDMHVLIDSVLTDAPRTVRVDGELDFATGVNTTLRADTIVINDGGVLHMGTQADPIHAGVQARVIFADGGPIDRVWDPRLFSRGLISLGQVTVFGADKTSYVTLAEGPRKKSTRLVLGEIPQGWVAGDQLAVTGVDSNAKQDERVGIRNISGNVVTLDKRLRYSHTAPEAGLSVYVANLSRNVSFESANPLDITRRGHVMFMHTEDVAIYNAGFYGLGRTNKSVPLNNVAFDTLGNPIAGTGTNPVGRYPVHFHRGPNDRNTAPAVIRGSAVVDSPGWGIVNHSSHVDVEDNVVFNVVGAAFVTEAGDEIGSFVRNIAIRSTGSGQPLRSREKLQDFAHTGDGFWLQGAGVDVADNIAVGQAHAGFVYFTQGLISNGQTTRFLARNLKDPALARGKETIDVSMVPISLFQGNEAYATARGMEIWFHRQDAVQSAPSVVQDLTVWGTKGSGIFLGYSGEVAFKNLTLLGDTKLPTGTGIGTNDGVQDISYENVHVEGFYTGIDVPPSSTIVIQGGFLNNVHNISVATASKHGRTLTIQADVQFGRLSDAALNGQTQFDVYLNAALDMKDQDITKDFNPDVIFLNDLSGERHQLYYLEQAADQIPFPSGASPVYVPAELIGKTNSQLLQDYGLAIGGTLSPATAATRPNIHGLVGTPAVYPTHPELLSDRFTKQLTDYQLIYKRADGTRVYDPQLVNLLPGWNVITRSVAGRNESFFVFGQTSQTLPPS